MKLYKLKQFSRVENTPKNFTLYLDKALEYCSHATELIHAHRFILFTNSTHQSFHDSKSIVRNCHRTLKEIHNTLTLLNQNFLLCTNTTQLKIEKILNRSKTNGRINILKLERNIALQDCIISNLDDRSRSLSNRLPTVQREFQEKNLIYRAYECFERFIPTFAQILECASKQNLETECLVLEKMIAERSQISPYHMELFVNLESPTLIWKYFLENHFFSIDSPWKYIQIFFQEHFLSKMIQNRDNFSLKYQIDEINLMQIEIQLETDQKSLSSLGSLTKYAILRKKKHEEDLNLSHIHLFGTHRWLEYKAFYEKLYTKEMMIKGREIVNFIFSTEENISNFYTSISNIKTYFEQHTMVSQLTCLPKVIPPLLEALFSYLRCCCEIRRFLKFPVFFKIGYPFGKPEGYTHSHTQPVVINERGSFDEQDPDLLGQMHVFKESRDYFEAVYTVGDESFNLAPQ